MKFAQDITTPTAALSDGMLQHFADIIDQTYGDQVTTLIVHHAVRRAIIMMMTQRRKNIGMDMDNGTITLGDVTIQADQNIPLDEIHMVTSSGSTYVCGVDATVARK